MTASPPPSTPPTGSVPSPVPPPPADESVRVFLSVGRSLALWFALLAGLLFLVFLAFTFLDIVLGRGPGDLVAAAYCLVSAAVNFVLWREIPGLEQLAAARRYADLRERLPVWAVLGIVCFVVVGVLLVAAWLKVELLVPRERSGPPVSGSA